MAWQATKDSSHRNARRWAWLGLGGDKLAGTATSCLFLVCVSLLALLKDLPPMIAGTLCV